MNSIADDLLDGADQIAGFLGWSKSRVYRAIDLGHLPVTRFGRRIVGSKRALGEKFQNAA